MTDQQKKRCNFYGCTIPAGIAHHHPLNGPVMRDPSAPLDDAERAELERFRLRERDSAYRQAVGMQNSIGTADWAKLQNASPLLDRSTTIRESRADRGCAEWPSDYARRKPFSRSVGTIMAWIFVALSGVGFGAYLVLEAVTAMGWAS